MAPKLLPPGKSKSLVGVDQLNADAANRVSIHVVVLARVLLSHIAPGPGLPHVVAELFIVANRFTQVVYRHAQMLNSLFMRFQKISVDIRGSCRGGDPFVAELIVMLVAHFKGEPQRLAAIGRVLPRSGVLHAESWKSKLLPVS